MRMYLYFSRGKDMNFDLIEGIGQLDIISPYFTKILMEKKIIKT
jgi:hypothetical protein